ncbi:hypothetical protein LJ739_02995 [Aestuariibacter halophilus]|uniref:DUF4034 domain-containing protein n=1 Tax=Fluctibacter halophilus TaxID=226011 RepID=A0ABS8G3P4_9ALTE|nr:hypothetical protein [Aestuariibacter halophilus]MCC2615209.1 hypothetical protein [Aestuariibacter halophilus]
MFKHRCVGIAAALLSLSVSAQPANGPEPAELFLDAEAFVQAQLYPAMIQVWGGDRRAWNQLLHVHACGVESPQERLALSYEAGRGQFERAIRDMAAELQMFDGEQAQAALSDVAQLAYRLFSASYAHGYARQVKLLNDLDDGIQEELCGDKVTHASEQWVLYSDAIEWQTVSTPTPEPLQRVNIHALLGAQAFEQLMSEQQARFDALVYSHAYQNTEAYDSLFFSVNGFDNVVRYQQQLDRLRGQSSVADEPPPHTDFAYLLLTSGYHWGTLSVLAMLEEEYPRLSEKARLAASELVSQVTASLPKQDDQSG